MRGPFGADELARMTGLPHDAIERYAAAGLLDPDGDGVFDDYDVLRLSLITGFPEDQPPEDILRQITERSADTLFEDLLYGTGPTYTVEQASERIGIQPERIREVQTALGVAKGYLDERDIEALSRMRQMIEIGLPWEAFLEGARVAGDTLRRLTDTEVRLVHDHVHGRLVKMGMSEQEIAREVRPMTEALHPLVEDLLRYLHHQHLLRAGVEDAFLHLQQADGARQGGLEASIVFVDLALFTSLVQAHGDEVAAQVLDRFDSLTRPLVLEHRGTLVKQIGDAFMLTFSDPVDAVRFSIALDDSARHEAHFPALRVGINHGPVLYRLGDYVGNTVNVASRVAAMAMPNEILLTEPVAVAAQAHGIQVEQVGVRFARGIGEPLPLSRVVRREGGRGQLDPVCGMVVDEPVAQLVEGSSPVVFCSQDCLRLFLDDPSRYARSA